MPQIIRPRYLVKIEVIDTEAEQDKSSIFKEEVEVPEVILKQDYTPPEPRSLTFDDNCQIARVHKRIELSFFGESFWIRKKFSCKTK